MSRDEDVVAGCVGGVGCLIGLFYIVFYGAIAIFVVWLLLWAFNIVERLPWQ